MSNVFTLDALRAETIRRYAPTVIDLGGGSEVELSSILRLSEKMETTGTFKYRKIDLVTDGFDPTRTKDPLYFRDPAKGYVKITKAVYTKVVAGGFKL